MGIHKRHPSSALQFFSILASIAQLERDLNADRVTIGLANARAKGKLIGRKKLRDSAIFILGKLAVLSPLTSHPISLSLSPNKHLYLDGEDLEKFPTLIEAFKRGSGHGLLYLDAATEIASERDEFIYWKDFSRLYLALFAATPGLETYDFKSAPIKIALPSDDLARLLLTAPPMKGGEYINTESITKLWTELESALITEIIESKKTFRNIFQRGTAHGTCSVEFVFTWLKIKNQRNLRLHFLRLMLIN